MKKISQFPHESEYALKKVIGFNTKKILKKYKDQIEAGKENLSFEFTKEEKKKIIEQLTTVAISTNKKVFESWRTLTDEELKRPDLKGAKYWIRENYIRVNKMGETFKLRLEVSRQKEFKETLKKFNASLDHRFDKMLKGKISNTDVDKLLTELKGFYTPNKEIKDLISELEQKRILKTNDIHKLKDWSNRRNELWARNDTGNLYANQLEDLFLENNIEKYVWRTMNDGKVRAEHEAKDGKVYKINDGILPGQDFGCRCWAEPVKKKEEK